MLPKERTRVARRITAGTQECSALPVGQVGRIGPLVEVGNGVTTLGDVPLATTLPIYRMHPEGPSPRISVPAQGPGPARSQHGRGGGISAIRSVMSALENCPLCIDCQWSLHECIAALSEWGRSHGCHVQLSMLAASAESEIYDACARSVMHSAHVACRRLSDRGMH